MNLNKLIIVALAIGILFSAVQIAAAAEETTDFNAAASIKENLLSNIGKRVAVRISAGDAIEGIIVKVGDRAVQLSKLSGKDYYDAIVQIDRIEAIVFKAR
ncbi:MAG: hypothetical protein HZB62_08825 [Nitrospirae bacterium]|nr:hypothetical protein [Nitrospirota bacterium]